MSRYALLKFISSTAVCAHVLEILHNFTMEVSHGGTTSKTFRTANIALLNMPDFKKLAKASWLKLKLVTVQSQPQASTLGCLLSTMGKDQSYYEENHDLFRKRKKKKKDMKI